MLNLIFIILGFCRTADLNNNYAYDNVSIGGWQPRGLIDKQ